MARASAPRGRSLDYAERWLRNGLEVNQQPAFYAVIDVDMSSARALIEAARLRDIRITYAHIIVRATAVALSRLPDLHVLVCGTTLHSPAQVDIAVSVAGDSAVSPVLIVEAADRKDLLALSREITERIPSARHEHEQLLALLRRWGWLMPFAFLRRAFLRTMSRSLNFRRKGSGTFQVSLWKDIEYALTPMFGSSGILTAGRVRDAVIAVNGAPAVRPVMTMTCCADHRVWDGRAAERFLLTVRSILESGELDREASITQ
jgi:pyruvate dehydrogenase E2 component (dihydrolipoamide acetyltransferase)